MAKEEPLEPKQPNVETTVAVRRGRVESVDLYEIKDNELEQLESGSTGDLYLNISVFLYSLAFSSVTTLSSATFKDPRWETVHVVIATMGILFGSIFLYIWKQSRKTLKVLCRRIRDRIQEERVTRAVTEKLKEQADDTLLPHEPP